MAAKTKITLMVWLLLIIGLDQLLGFSMARLAPKHKQDKRIQLLLDNQINAEILILGSSRALNNYAPQVLQDVCGMSCYNLGFSGTNIPFHEELLKLKLNHGQKPTCIIYNLDDPGTLYANEGISFRIDALNPYVENNEINEIVCRHQKKYEWPTYVCRSYRHNGNFINSLRYLMNGIEDLDRMVSNIDSMGANLIPANADIPPAKFLQKRLLPTITQTDSNYLASFKRIQQLCLENNIQLILCFPPLLMSPMVGFEDKIAELTMPETKTFQFSQLLYKKPHLFLNPDHLNSEGAFVFSDTLAKTIRTILK